MPKITVAMPAYNDAPYIEEAINSILNQSFHDFELLIINDGSSDGTANIIEEFTDKRIRIIHFDKNQGRPFARNVALNEAKGAYLVWMDADDIAVHNRLALQLDFMSSSRDIAFCGGYMQCFGESKHLVRVKTSPEAIHAGIILYSSILNCTACMHLESLHKYNLVYHQELLRVQDYAFFAQALLSTPLRASNIPTILTNYRYFNRKTTPIYHIKAVKYILLALNLPCDDVSCYKHTILSIGAHESIPRIEPMEIILWANELYEAILQQPRIIKEHFLRICHSKIETFLSNLNTPQSLLRAYAALPIAKTHNIQKLFK